MAQTTNYGLKQWESWERVTRGEVNELVGGVDAALAGLEADKAELHIGSYTGDGEEMRAVSLGLQPKALLLAGQNGVMNAGYHCYGGLAFTGLPCIHLNQNVIELTADGFLVRYDDQGGSSLATNTNGMVYYYLAVV